MPLHRCSSTHDFAIIFVIILPSFCHHFAIILPSYCIHVVKSCQLMFGIWCGILLYHVQSVGCKTL